MSLLQSVFNLETMVNILGCLQIRDESKEFTLSVELWSITTYLLYVPI